VAIGSPHGFVLIGLYFGAPRVVEAGLEGGLKNPKEVMEILEAFDLTGTLRGAAVLAGCDHKTVAHWVRAREQAGGGLPVSVRPRPRVDAFAVKIDDWVDRSRGRIRADVAHQRLVATGYLGSEHTTRRAVAAAKRAWRAEHGRRTRPWVTEPGCGCSGTMATGRGWPAGRRCCSAPGWRGPAFGSSSRCGIGRCRRW
jgi:hypothetical protein